MQHVQVAGQVQSAQQFCVGRTESVRSTNQTRRMTIQWRWTHLIATLSRSVAATCPSCPSRPQLMRPLCDSTATCRRPATARTSATVCKSTASARSTRTSERAIYVCSWRGCRVAECKQLQSVDTSVCVCVTRYTKYPIVSPPSPKSRVQIRHACIKSKRGFMCVCV